MNTTIKLTSAQVSENIKNLQSFMSKHKLEQFYVSSFDIYLNEYVPLEDCHRFYLTGFTGSTAELLVPSSGKPRLYVDGRYHEQADLECDLSIVEVVKVPANQGVLSTLECDLAKASPKVVGMEGDRAAVSLYERVSSEFKVELFNNQELASVIDFAPMASFGKIQHLTKELTGESTGEKLERIFTDKSKAYYITALDSLAWITNCRGYHLPNNCAFVGTGFATHDKVYAFIDSAIEVECPDDKIEFINCKGPEVEAKLSAISKNYKLSEVYIDKNALNTASYLMLTSVFGEKKLAAKVGGLIDFHSIKTDAELDLVRQAFKQGDKAIYNTVCWVKEQVKNGIKISELDLYHQTTKSYQEQGCKEQSFNTISGVGANGSIIHYGDPKADVFINDESMVLLDSGGYFDSGFATDTTRTFMGSTKEGSEEQKRIYTYVLKSALACQNAIFKSGTRGSGLDAITRQPMYQAGYDYAHGTGHGVGLNVHESGAGIGPTRTYLMKPGQVVSIEPGIYIPGFGGVRIENISIVKKHPEFEGFLCFENLVYIGFEKQLIDESLLTAQEKVWLEEYEAECVKRGTSFLQ